MKINVRWMEDTKAGESLLNNMLSHSVFAEEPKMTIKALELLVYIARRTTKNEQDADWGMSYKEFQNAFRRSNKSYTDFIEALIKLGLLELTKAHTKPTKDKRGTSARYRVTKKLRDAYLKSSKEDIMKGYDPKALFAYSGSVLSKRSRRRRAAQEISDDFRKAHEILCSSVEVDMEMFLKESECERKNSALAIFAQLRRTDFEVSKSNGKSSRLYHTLVNLPSDFRKYLKVDDKVYSAEVDIRACWSTFLEAQLLLKHPKNDALKAECAKWRDLFCNPSIDPREAIIKEYGLNATVAELKEYLNKYLNGYTVTEEGDHRELKPIYSILDEWFADAYPAMYKAWKDAKPKKLASQIGLKFETPLMSDPRIYSLAKKLDVVLYYQFDGFGIFARPMSKSELEKILVSICELMQKISIDKFDVPIVVKQELFI